MKWDTKLESYILQRWAMEFIVESASKTTARSGSIDYRLMFNRKLNIAKIVSSGTWLREGKQYEYQEETGRETLWEIHLKTWFLVSILIIICAIVGDQDLISSYN